MTEKKKARSWKEIQTAIAAISLISLLTLCNLLAAIDRHEDGGGTVNSAEIVTSTRSS